MKTPYMREPLDQQEEWEANLSALLDGELEPELLLPTLDALSKSAALQQFYHQARALQSRLPKRPETVVVDAPAVIWQKIQESATTPVAAPVKVRRLFPEPARLLAAAAVFFIVGIFVAKYAPWHWKIPVIRTGPIELQLGEATHTMTEERFVDLTAELLRADRKYHRKLLDVLQTVAASNTQKPQPDQQNRHDESVDLASVKPEPVSPEGGKATPRGIRYY